VNPRSQLGDLNLQDPRPRCEIRWCGCGHQRPAAKPVRSGKHFGERNSSFRAVAGQYSPHHLDEDFDIDRAVENPDKKALLEPGHGQHKLRQMVAAHPASHCENPLMFGFQINEIELTYQERPAWLLQIRNERTNK
jgi:hypothetical protein